MSAVWKNIFTTYRSSHIRKPLANLICSATTHVSSHFGECCLAWHIHAFSPNHVRRNPCTPHTSSSLCQWRATALFEATLGKPVDPESPVNGPDLTPRKCQRNSVMFEVLSSASICQNFCDLHQLPAPRKLNEVSAKPLGHGAHAA